MSLLDDFHQINPHQNTMNATNNNSNPKNSNDLLGISSNPTPQPVNNQFSLDIDLTGGSTVGNDKPNIQANFNQQP